MAPLPRLALARGRAMRLLGRAAMRRSPRCRMRGAPRWSLVLQALFERVHQADHVVGVFLVLRGLDRLAGGFAADQRLQRVLVFVLEFRRVEMRGLGFE